jgi:hypothetical protein
MRNAPLLTSDEAKALFNVALEMLSKKEKGLLSMTQIVDAIGIEIAHALAVSAGELHLHETAPPWVKHDRRKLSNTAV